MMAETPLEPDAGDDSVVAAILSTQEDEPPKPEGDDIPTEPIDAPQQGEEEAEPSEKEEAEGEKEGEEEGADDEGAEDVDVDELLVEVTINGKAEEIPLKALKQNYSGNKFIEQNIQKSVEIRKAVEYNAAVLYQANQQVAEKLKSLNAVLDSVSKPNIDWDDLRARNPSEYLLRREELREIQEKQKLVQEEVQNIEAEQAALQSQARQRMVLDQAQRLASQLPDLADPKKAPVVMDRLIRTAEYFGFQKPEVESVVDHRQMLVLWAAANWLNDQYQRSQVRQRANGNGDASESPQPKKVLIRPGSSQNGAASQAKRLTAEIYNRARQTGSVEDVAKTLIMSPSPRRR